MASNPFADLKAAVQGNPKREYFISPAEAQKVLDACPDAEWRLIFALARVGGLRCPSEIMGLTWGEGRFTVHSPKTEHHPGQESRQAPLFPELVPHLQEVFEQAEPGTEYVITRYQQSNSHLGMELRRILRRAGLTPWPKLFQNLRSTRQTELTERFPLHVVCAWIGNSQAVAMKHYLQVTDEHFRQAVRNPVQQPAASARNGLQPAQGDSGEPAICGSLRGIADTCKDADTTRVGDTGLEPVTSCLSSRRSCQLS